VSVSDLKWTVLARGINVLGNFSMILSKFHACERVICRGGDGVGGHFLQGNS
jgi:hypothetical protein